MLLATIIFIAVGLIIIGPQLTIWSLNTLFHLAIPITLKTWFAVAWLGGIFGGLLKLADNDK